MSPPPALSFHLYTVLNQFLIEFLSYSAIFISLLAAIEVFGVKNTIKTDENYRGTEYYCDPRFYAIAYYYMLVLSIVIAILLVIVFCLLCCFLIGERVQLVDTLLPDQTTEPTDQMSQPADTPPSTEPIKSSQPADTTPSTDTNQKTQPADTPPPTDSSQL